MENEVLEFRKINERCNELKYWIAANAPQCLIEEKHLTEGSPERAYWAHGYLTGLMDVLRLFSRGIADQEYGSRGSNRKAA
jgi:hypothetical protein